MSAGPSDRPVRYRAGPAPKGEASAAAMAAARPRSPTGRWTPPTLAAPVRARVSTACWMWSGPITAWASTRATIRPRVAAMARLRPAAVDPVGFSTTFKSKPRSVSSSIRAVPSVLGARATATSIGPR